MDKPEASKLFDHYFEVQKAVHYYFGYVEDWKAIPLDDQRGTFWRLDGEGPGNVYWAKTEEELRDEAGCYYGDEIYTQRFLPKWVYRGKDFTLVCCNPHTDGNFFIRIFDNALERPTAKQK